MMPRRRYVERASECSLENGRCGVQKGTENAMRRTERGRAKREDHVVKVNDKSNANECDGIEANARKFFSESIRGDRGEQDRDR